MGTYLMRAMVAVIVSLYVGVVCAAVFSETSKDVGYYALFQDGPTGALVLFTPVNAQQRMVAKYSDHWHGSTHGTRGR